MWLGKTAKTIKSKILVPLTFQAETNDLKSFCVVFKVPRLVSESAS